MCQEKIFKIPEEVFICGTKFVDQSVNSHIPITGDLCHLIATTLFHVFLLLPFPLWLWLVIVLTFLIFNDTFSFCPAQEHLMTPNCVMTSHPSCHLRRIISFVTCPEGLLRKFNMKTLRRLRVVAIKGPM